jgi:F-type H+-transporting ATPase subunit delta
MAVRGVAKRYAQAVFDIANENGTHQMWLADLTRLAAAASDPVTGEFFTGPTVSAARKREAIEQLLPGPDKQLARNLANMLIERRRFDILPEMVQVFNDLLLDAQGIAIADVTTAIELTPAEQEQVRRRLAQIVGKQIELRLRVDPALIGGIVARIGDQLIDGSVLTQLRSMRAALAR